MPIEWDVPAKNAAFDTANMQAALTAAIDKPGKVHVNLGDFDRGFARAAKIVEATYATPYLPRARMEPGNATVLVTDDRVDIWIGDQSPQETRYSASQITGIPESNVYLHLCHLGGGFGRNGNGPQAEQAIYIANQNRGTPIHLLWTREEDFINSAYRAMSVARLRAALDADGWPIALEVRTAMDGKAPGPTASFDKASRYFVPNYRFSTHPVAFHVPVGTRRGVGQPAHEFYRESFIDELAHAAGKDPYLYRRELISRTNLPYKADMIKALDMAAEMSGWGKPLPQGVAQAIALEERGAETNGNATISAQVLTVSISKQGALRLERVDMAHEEGFGLVNPLSVQETARGPGHLVLQRHHASRVQYQGRPHRGEQLRHVPAVADQRRSAGDQHQLLQDRALAERHGPRPRHIDSILHCRCGLPDHRKALSGPAVAQPRPDVELNVFG